MAMEYIDRSSSMFSKVDISRFSKISIQNAQLYRESSSIILFVCWVILHASFCLLFLKNLHFRKILPGIYSTGIAMLLSNVFCRDATRSAKKINPHANPALNPRNSRAKPSLFPR